MPRPSMLQVICLVMVQPAVLSLSSFCCTDHSSSFFFFFFSSRRRHTRFDCDWSSDVCSSDLQILGLMVGPALGGLLADHLGIRAAFVGSSGLAVIAGLNILLVYHEPRSSAPQRRMRPKASLQALIRTHGFVPILVVLFAGSFTDRSYQPLIPLFVASLVPPDGAVASLTGIIVAGGALATALSANAASRLVPRFTHAQVLWGALVAGICGAALMAFSHTAWQLGLLRVGVGLFAGSILTLAYGLVGTVVPIEQRSSAFGALNSAAMVGSAMGPIMA